MHLKTVQLPFPVVVAGMLDAASCLPHQHEDIISLQATPEQHATMESGPKWSPSALSPPVISARDVNHFFAKRMPPTRRPAGQGTVSRASRAHDADPFKQEAYYKAIPYVKLLDTVTWHDRHRGRRVKGENDWRLQRYERDAVYMKGPRRTTAQRIQRIEDSARENQVTLPADWHTTGFFAPKEIVTARLTAGNVNYEGILKIAYPGYQVDGMQRYYYDTNLAAIQAARPEDRPGMMM